MQSRKLAALVAMGIFAGCATPPEKIEASYVSPMLYQNLTCEQLGAEATRVSAGAQAAIGAQKQEVNQDAAAMAVGLVIFWPAMLLTQGDGAKAAEVARLKGEMAAIEEASKVNNCGIVFEKAPPPKKGNAACPAGSIYRACAGG